MASEYSALGSSPQESPPLPAGGVRRLKVPVSREQYPRVSILGISLTGLVAAAMLFGKPGRRYWSKDLRPALTLNSDLQVGAYEVISQGSCRSRGLFPILQGHECKAAAETLHLLLNSSSLLTTELPDVPEGCYYCHNFEDKTYTLWLGKNAKSRNNGAETSHRLKTRQPICRKTALSTTPPVFSCEMGDHWKDVWSEDQRHFCCRSHGKGCTSGSGSGSSSSSADSAKATTTTAPTTLPWGPVHEWEVTSPAGVVVRGEPCGDCSVVRTKAQYEVFAGRQQGSWIRLAGETGFVLQHQDGADLAVMAPKYYLIRLHNEKCASLGRVPIHDMRECGMAAKAMGLSVTQPSDTSKAPTPEGCYYFKHHGSESLWLNTNAENRGRGASVWPGRERLPLCALPLRTTTSSMPLQPTVPPPTVPPAPRTPRGTATPVTIFMTLRNLEYNRLLTTPNLATLIVAQVKKVVLGTLHEKLLREKHLQVILSAGSVEVSATVVPPPDFYSGPLREKLNANARPCCRELARKLEGIKAIADVATGSLDCSNVTVADSPGARISLSSPAPLTTSTVASTSTGTTLTTTSATATSTVTKATTSTRTVSETTATSTRTTTTASRTSTTPEPTTTATTTVASSSTSTRTTHSSSTATRTETTATRTATSTSSTLTTTVPTSSTRTATTTLSSSTTFTTMTMPASKLLRPGGKGSKWDCGGDQIVERGWSQEQQHYCCAHHGRGCFDCLAGRSHWQVGWAAEKKRYCCKTSGVGCGFDCSSGPWTQSRRVWCCVHRNIQCEAKLPARPAAAASDEELPSDATGAVKKGDYNCYDNDPDVWPPAKRHWCCMHRDKGCSSRPFDCQAELQSWQVSWSQDKVDWCCRFEQLGCPMYDCGVGLGNAETAWSQGKKAWCCRTQHLGCPKPYNCHDGMENYFVHWSEEKRKWCCATEKLGCLVPYRCKASADLWETGWSARKKAWCCEHQKICPRLWDCTTGASNWEVEWSRAQQTWCCRHHNVGCGYNCDSGQEDRATWSFRERLWCCQYRGIACAASEKFRAG